MARFSTVLVSALFFCFVSIAALAAPVLEAPPIVSLQAFPKEIFAKEGTAVLFTAKATQKDARLALIEIDADGRALTYVGIMADDRTIGDRIADDGIFSRKFEIKAIKPKVLRFAVIVDDGSVTEASFRSLPPLAENQFPRTEVTAALRPTLVQLLRNVWDRVASPEAVRPETSVY